MVVPREEITLQRIATDCVEYFHLDEKPDFSRHNYTELIDIEGFRWTDNVTPFTQPQLPIYAVVAYLVVVFSLKVFMSNRKPYNMSWVTAIHNLFLCILSIVMSFGQLYAAIEYSKEYHPSYLVCDRNPDPLQGKMYYFALIYHYSKYYELLDTLIIVFRKNPITFLHIWHHTAMVVITRIWLTPGHPLAWWSVWLNSFVHIPMYWFYCKKSLGYDVWWKKYITQLQLVQFTIFTSIMIFYFIYYMDIFGLFGGSFDFIYTLYNSAPACTGALGNVYTTLFFNLSLLFLFSRFYGKTYTPQQSRGQAAKGKKNAAPAKKQNRKKVD